MIPGNPAELESAALKLDAAADLLATSRRGVLRAAGGMDGWEGPASDAARAALNGFAQRPIVGARVLEQAAPVLRDYAAALRGAQIAVARGQGLIDEGLVASNSAAATESARTAGVSLATEGDDMVRKALDQVRFADERAAARIRELAEEAQSMRPPATGGPGPSVLPAGARTGSADITGPNAGVELSGPQSGKLGEAKVFADLVKAQAQGAMQDGDLRLTGKIEGNLGVEAAGSLSATDAGAVAKAEASVGLKAKAEGRADNGIYGAYGRAEGMAGAEAGVSAALKQDRVDLNAGAFAGAKGKIAAGTDIGGIGGGFTAEGWAGPGAQLKAHAGMDDDGKFRISAGAGVSPVIGGALGFELTIDPEKVEQTYNEAADAVGDFGESVGRGWESSTGTISKALDGPL